MTRCSLSYAVVLMRVSEPCTPFCQPGEAARKLRSILREIVPTKPIDGDQDHEGRMLRGRGLRGRGGAAKYERGNRNQGFWHAPI